MIKTIVSITLAAAMMMMTVSGAEAFWMPQMPSNDIKVTNDWTKVTTTALTSVTTGSNQQSGGMWSAPKLTTGAVGTLTSIAGSQVNMTVLPSCNCSRVGDITVANKATFVTTGATTGAVTGGNVQTSMFATPNMTTGAVSNLGSQATSDVNWTQFGVSL